MCCLKCSKLCVESPRAKRWSGVSSRSDGAGKLYRGMQFTVAERGSVGEQNAETKGRKGVRQRETPSHTAVPEVQMAYSACHPSSLFQGYHRSNHFIATQGEYPSKAVVFMCMCVCMCACRAVNTFCGSVINWRWSSHWAYSCTVPCQNHLSGKSNADRVTTSLWKAALVMSLN